MSIKISVVTCCLLVAVGMVMGDQELIYEVPPPQYDALPRAYPPAQETYPDAPPKYSYNYGVSDGYSGANYGHAESRDGYKTEGSYSVDLPDGRKQIVSYADNGDGLVAEVTYEGEAQYPAQQPASYSPPAPAPYA